MASEHSGQSQRFPLVLADNQLLRFITFFLLYACQGVPIGLTLIAVPAWMAAEGQSAGVIASVTSTALLPWGIKMFNGLIMERYAFLPMGRRRAWLVGAQCVICLALTAVIVLKPGIEDRALLIVLLFSMNLAATFQDSAIDGIAVDVTPAAEHGRINSFMAAGQGLGMAGSGALAGYLVGPYGLQGAALPLLLFVALILFAVTLVLERAGERRLPWSTGAPAIHAAGTAPQAWLVLLKRVFQALARFEVLVFLPSFACYGIFAAIGDIATPVFAAQKLGWSTEETASLISSAGFAAGLSGLFFIGFISDRVGILRVGMTSFLGLCVIAVVFANALPDGVQAMLFPAFVFAVDIAAQAIFIAATALAMRVCRVEIAASQFALMVAVPNLVRVGMQNFVQPLLDAGGFALAWSVTGAAGAIGAVLYFTAYQAITRASAAQPAQ
ncbi:MAG: MFS transporter [Pseudomonadota bacterium]